MTSDIPLNQHRLEKATLRRSLLQTRQSLELNQWRDYSDRLCTHLQRSEPFAKAQTILAYVSIRQEPDLSPLWLKKQTQKQWGLPRCVDKSLAWHLWSPDQRLQPGIYGIPEPDPSSLRLDPEAVDLILVPGVACDRQGYRLGYGGGFYDRLLSAPPWSAKPTIGIVFELAHLPRLPIDTWDQRLHFVCTEKGLYQSVP